MHLGWRSALYTYLNQRFLAFDLSLYSCLFDLNDQIPRFQVSRYRYCDVDLSNFLCPFIWQSGLFCLFFLAGFGVKPFSGGWRWRGGSFRSGHFAGFASTVGAYEEVWAISDAA